MSLHAGLICLDASSDMDLDVQIELFDQALHELSVGNDLVNQVLEITLEDDESFYIRRYHFPATGD